MFTIPTLHNKKYFGQFWFIKFWPIFPILAPNFLVQNWPKLFFIMQSGYGEHFSNENIKQFWIFSIFDFLNKICFQSKVQIYSFYLTPIASKSVKWNSLKRAEKDKKSLLCWIHIIKGVIWELFWDFQTLSNASQTHIYFLAYSKAKGSCLQNKLQPNLQNWCWFDSTKIFLLF